MTLNRSILGLTHFSLQVWASALRGTGWTWGLGHIMPTTAGLTLPGCILPPPKVRFFCECEPEVETRNQDIGRQTNCTEDGPVLPAGGGYCSVGNSDRGKEDQQHQNGQSDDGEDDE